ncbi:MAG TPA: TonB-dependent receptor [Bryobacteraceae bacterium]|nr:TonB-dependent receptor [Bryobacteraceae bacterium]
MGTITDPSGAAVPDAVITVTNESTNIGSTARSNDEGFYRVERLIQGTYRIQVEKVGFKTFVSTAVPLAEAQTVRVNAGLEVGTETQKVEVVEALPLLQTESPQISQTLPFSVRKDLPTVAPSFFNTLTLAPGAVTTSPNYYIAFNGSTASEYNYSVDGQTFRDPGSGHNAFIGHFDEWQQDLIVSSTNNSAEYSQLGEVNVATKSGTNAFHGSGVGYYTSGGLQGRNPFSPQPPSGVNEYFAGSLGGRIKKDKAFFFVAYGGNRNHTAKVVSATVPTPLMRQGNFSEVKAIIDPQTDVPFPGNIIPANRLSPVATNFINRFYPLPNFGPPGFSSLNYRTVWPQVPAEDDVVGRVDYRFTDKHSVFARYTFDEGNRGGLASGSLPTVGYREGYRRDQNATISDLFAVSPSLYNEFSVGFSRDNNLILPSTNYGPAQSGLQVAAAPVPAIPSIALAGFTTVSQGNYSDAVGEVFNLRDTVSWTHGRHRMKFGFLALRGDDPNTYSLNGSNVEGNFSFTNTFATGYGMANFLLGLPTSEFRVNPAYIFKYTYTTRTTVQAFAQDDIQLGSKLTVNLGLRYEDYGPWSEKRGRMSNFDLQTGKLAVPTSSSISLLDPNLVLTYGSLLETAAQGRLPSSMVDFSRLNFAPRIGFAYRLAGKTVVRGGYGIFYDFNPPATQTGAQLYTSPQSFPLNSITGGVPLYHFPNPFATVNPSQGFGILSPSGAAAQERIPYSQQWSLTVEHQFGNNLARLSYVGTVGVDDLIGYDANVPLPTTVQLPQSARPFPQFGPISWVQNGPGHHYNGLSADFMHRAGGGLYFDSNFTWAKDLGLNQGNGLDQNLGVLDPFDAKLDYGPTLNIPSFRWVTTANWQLPIGRGKHFASSLPGWANAIAGGWSMTGVYTMQSGDWLTPTYCGYDPTGSPEQDFYCGRPDRIANGNLPSGQRSQTEWFNPAAFTFPGASPSSPLTPPANPIGRFGNSGVGIIEGPGLWQFDFGLIKSMPIREKAHLSLFVFATNLFNHPNLADPLLDISVPSTAGQIQGIRSKQNAESNDPGIGMRILTLGARFEF